MSMGGLAVVHEAGYIRQLLLDRGHSAEIVIIVTTGDKILEQAGGRAIARVESRSLNGATVVRSLLDGCLAPATLRA